MKYVIQIRMAAILSKQEFTATKKKVIVGIGPFLWELACLVILEFRITILCYSDGHVVRLNRLIRQAGNAMKQENKEFALSNFKPYEMGKNEEYMSEGQIEHFTSILQNWKQELMEEVDRTKQYMQAELNNHADPNDRASQEEEFSLELRTRDRERKLIKKIEKTILLIESGDYGYCEACGVEIGIRRLEARPTAELCIDCKTLAEIKERQLGK